MKRITKSHYPRQITAKLTALTLTTSTALYPMSASAINEEELVEFGDAMQIVLPAIGLGATGIYKDKEGLKQWAWSGATSVGTTTVLKGVYNKIRPNASNSATSFPSGHTTAVFWGASFLDQRYGAWWGVPAYTAATITAYSRVISDNHHIDDTVMGASIALMSSWYWVTPHDDSVVSLIPYQQNDAVGVSFHFDGSGKMHDNSGLREDDRWRYSIIFGPASQQKNLVTAPTSTGTQFDLENFRETNDPTTTANAIVEWFAGRHRSLFSVEPFEARDFGAFTQPTDFAGVTYNPGEEIRSSYRLTDIRLQYYFDLMPESKTILEIGGGISYQHTTVELGTTSGTASSKATSDIWMPLANAVAGYQFTPRFSVAAEISGLSLNDQQQFDASLSAGYRLDRYWDVGIGFGVYQHKTESSELSSEVDYNVLMTSVGYSFY